jgi:hypothetical protein
LDAICAIALGLAVWHTLAEKSADAAAIQDILVTVEESRGSSWIADPVFPMPMYTPREAARIVAGSFTYWRYQPAENAICYWPFSGPLHAASESGPQPGAAFDFYWYLPAPAKRKPPYVVTRFAPHELPEHRDCYLLEWRPYRADRLLVLPAPVSPPPLALVVVYRVEGSASDSRSGSLLFGLTAQSDAGLRGPILDIVQPHARLLPLTHPDERVRYHTALQLGRTNALYAVGPLRASLAGDPSPAVREAAARSLAILGGLAEITALQRAARDDADDDVRRTAAFAAEMIESRCGMIPASIGHPPHDSRQAPRLIDGFNHGPAFIF